MITTESKILLHGKRFKPFLGRTVIQERVSALGLAIAEHYQHKASVPLILGILNGSYIFMADLSRAIPIPHEIAFVHLRSYEGMTSSGQVEVVYDGAADSIAGRDVLIVEDIIDTGRTLAGFMTALEAKQPRSLRLVTMLLKPESLQFDVRPDWIGFSIPDDFVVGYGMDFDGLGRNLPDLYQLDA